MNFPLLDMIARTQAGILATVLETRGHTYKKKGEKALFTVDDPIPLYGNLGSLCVDQAIIRSGREAVQHKRPKTISIDSSEPDDIHLGYGTYCGGTVDLLLEPIFDKHKTVYAQVRCALENGESVYLLHDIDTGEITTSETRPEDAPNMFVEVLPAPTRLYVFGATPLAGCIMDFLKDMDFELHVIDWRDAYLQNWDDLPYVTCHKDRYPFDPRAFVLIISHSFERDRDVVKLALQKDCKYIGMLSSKTRRDKLYEELLDEGFSKDNIKKISSPVGIEIGGRSDPEIAVSIVAELVRTKNR
jgi:xanthine dehydrogenase accessory factor